MPRLLTLLLGISLLILVTAPSRANENYAVIIANKTYLHTDDVSFADRDGDAMRSAFVNALGVPDRPQNLTRLDDQSATDLNILFGRSEGDSGTLASLVSGASKGATLFVYFAGHGSRALDESSGRSEAYLLGTDSRPARLEQSAYPLDLLKRKLKTLQQKIFPQGRVVLMLEACFSGRSNAGELVKGVSAPAMGRPIILTAENEAQGSGGFALLAAASGDEFAIWDSERQQSVFTDALVSGLFGEADLVGGNGDDEVTISELRRYIQRHINSRLRAVRKGAKQRALIDWGGDELVVAKSSDRLDDWPPLLERRHKEYLVAGRLLAERNPDDIRAFLRNCTYCPDKAELASLMREERRKKRFCALEETEADRLVGSDSAPALTAFLSRCKCCPQRNELERRLTSLGSGGGLGESSDSTHSTETAETAVKSTKVKECDLLAADTLDPNAVVVGVPQHRIDSERATVACRAAIEQNQKLPRFRYQLARSLAAANDYAGAAEILQELSAEGYAPAMVNLAAIVRHSGYHEDNTETVTELLEQAGKSGLPHAKTALATLHLNNWLSKYSERQVIDLLESASEEGDPDAMALLGGMYEAGLRVGRDEKRAAYWQRKNAAAIGALSEIRHAWTLDQAIGVERNANSASAHAIRALAKDLSSIRDLLRRTADGWSIAFHQTLLERLSRRKVYSGPTDGEVVELTRTALRGLDRLE